jgi:hypothetical protein
MSATDLFKEYHDNRVCLQLYGKIRDQQQFNSVISSYQKHLGGYEIVFCEYDFNNDVLEITYRCNKSKQIVLKENNFLNEFSILKNSNKDRENYPILIDSFVVESSMEISYLQNYVKMLQNNNNNRLKRLESSDHLVNTFYFQFQFEINFKVLFHQHQEYLDLLGKNIKFYRAYQTFLILASLNLKDKSPQSITQYLNRVFHEDDKINWQSFNDFSIIPFVIIKFSTVDLKRKYLVEADKLLDSDFIVSIEDVLNVNLLNKFISQIESKNNENFELTKIMHNNGSKIKQNKNKSDFLVSKSLNYEFKSHYKKKRNSSQSSGYDINKVDLIKSIF